MSIIFLNSFFVAFFIELLISFADVFLFVINVKSINDTFTGGTLIAVPSSLPFSSGKTNPTARAAPVEVGIIEFEAALAVYRDLCSVSTIR